MDSYIWMGRMLADLQELIYISSVQTLGVVWKTRLERWTVGKDREREWESQGNTFCQCNLTMMILFLRHFRRTVYKSSSQCNYFNGEENNENPVDLWFILHHHHHIVLAARISLTLSRHSSLSFIALGRSSGQQPVSSHSCWMYVRAGRPAFARPIHKSTSLMSSSLLLQQCPACLVRLTWIVFVIGGRWPYSWCLVGCCCQDLFRIALRNQKFIKLIFDARWFVSSSSLYVQYNIYLCVSWSWIRVDLWFMVKKSFSYSYRIDCC